MPTKRKPSYEQQLALDAGRAVMRRNQRARRAAREAADKAAVPAAHEHRFGDWSSRYVGNGYEKRECACGAFEARPFKLYG